MTKIPTETVLNDWRYGQTQAERLCAELLLVEGFESVDPQCPLGGPDGRKDLLCMKNGSKLVAACSFPTTRPDFKSIKSKFEDDLAGVEKNEAQGIIFFVNQPLTPGERVKLVNLAKPHSADIYHLERIRTLLDSPKGYGIRLEYLRIPMSEEEQLGFWSTLKEDLTTKFITQERAILELHNKMDAFMARTSSLLSDLTSNPSSLQHPLPTDSSDLVHFPTSSLSISKLLWIHRLVTDDLKLPQAQRGIFRNVNVWIGSAGASPEEARYTPPPSNEVFNLTSKLLEDWRSQYSLVLHSDKGYTLYSIAKFHHDLLSIHPFLDANGRVARAILQQQSLELLHKNITANFTAEPATYYDCLQKADAGDITNLKNLIMASLE